ncbi:MAG: ABC-2 family transporter protein [Candidatus Kaiserbacteria bacterium]|nr:ABC-2 family transporter protein [Candidatus Kaiserbacteria bacterium]
MTNLRQQIKQARIIISTAWQRGLNYRFTVVMYRIGEMAEVLALILMWTAIYSGGGGTIRGFTLNEMITYVLIGNLCAVAVRNFLPGFIATDINDGKLSMFLVKPISYVRFIFLHELGRAFLSTVVSLVSQVLILFFFLDKIIINTDPRYLVLIVLMVSCAFVIELLLGFLIGTIAFWTEDVEGIYATLDRVKRFFSGGYFPLTLLPVTLATASSYLPFQYSFFAPAALYLKKMDLRQGLH